ncbi:hypothetical protein MRS44_016031 [Fusarium solani]|uniref:uncharacterized protein n=1 Tax=Fusarium solani TaxID=169388 RepID=UPI0032C42C67|nr:hypothetical protein MRS44_016031 [Fusarium solani]
MAKEKSADEEDDDERDAELKHAIRNFYVSLICQTVGSRPFRSAVLSFCAMLSRKKAFTRREANDDEQRKRCVWNELGNFNSVAAGRIRVSPGAFASDDLDLDDYGGSWLTDERNAEILKGTQDALLRQIEHRAELRGVYVRTDQAGGLSLCPKAMACYEAHVACARAEVPQFQVAWWRQAAASITKEKFSAKERANFDLEEIAAAEEVEDEAALADLAGMSNHSYRTFNHAYAGSTTLTMSTLLHRAYRASQSWRSLFRAQGLLNACKKARFRTRPAQKEDGLLKVARRLYNDPGLQLRRPGQRDGMLATLGPRPAEQVIVILATGSGKTLIVIVSAALEGAATTILILPTVALRGNMLVRLGKVALKHYVWSPGSSKSAPLVIMSAEAACTESFLEYANRLADR